MFHIKNLGQVEGEPQLLGEASVVASTGDTALLEQVLCSDPPATKTTTCNRSTLTEIGRNDNIT